MALLVIAGGGLAWFQPWVPTEEPASIERMAFSLPDKPSIAVLPFTNMSGDAEQEYFVDGMTDDLITDLSKISGLFVIARTSTFLYKGKSQDVRDIGKALNARYVVEGSVRRENNAVRINAQLIDTTTGHHVWAERYDAKMEDVFALQDRITQQVVDALALTLSSGEQEALGRPDSVNLQSYDLFLQGSVAFQRFSKDDTFLARKLFERAIDLDSAFSRAYAMLAWTHVFEYTNGWSQMPQDSLSQAMALAERSIALNEYLPIAYFVRGLVNRERQDFETALIDAKTAISIEPSYANAYILLATLLYYAGRAEEGLVMVDGASRLNPHHPSNYPFHRGQALFILKRYDEALAAFQSGLQQNPTSQRLRVWLAATYAEVGRLDDAEWEASQILDDDPGFSPDRLLQFFPFRKSEELIRFNGALRKAGFGELDRTGSS
jgi:TolB-like protein